MSLPREQKKSQPPWLDLILFGMVLGFFGYSLQSFVDSRSPVRKVDLPKTDLSETAQSEPARQPASRAFASAESTEVLRVPCFSTASQKTISSSARLVQIQASLCENEGQGKATWYASNQSSGEEILVFVNPKERTISTSYFSLRAGMNELSFIRDLGKGATKYGTLKIERKAD